MKKRNSSYTLILDAGTTSVKAFVIDNNEKVIAKSSKSLKKRFPHPGWVEQSPQEILILAKHVLREVVHRSKVPISQYIGCGITAQRETVIAWDKDTSEAIYPAIVWQDTRTSTWCKNQSNAIQKGVQEKTGLPIDPYFSASKMSWILENVSRAKTLEAHKSLAIGTVDSWLLWNLLEESPYLTDYTNASRTLLFNIKNLQWDPTLASIFGVPLNILPTVQPSISTYGILKNTILGQPMPVLAVAGDQQASLYAAGSHIGTTKATYGTGTFIMQVIGSKFTLCPPFFTTLAVHHTEKPWYALEAKVSSGVENVDEILQNPSLLQAHLKNIIQNVDTYISKLPLAPNEIVIDGGWTRDNKILPLQSNSSSFPIREQKIYDGTALGIHRMIQQKYS